MPADIRQFVVSAAPSPEERLQLLRWPKEYFRGVLAVRYWRALDADRPDILWKRVVAGKPGEEAEIGDGQFFLMMSTRWPTDGGGLRRDSRVYSIVEADRSRNAPHANVMVRNPGRGDAEAQTVFLIGRAFGGLRRQNNAIAVGSSEQGAIRCKGQQLQAGCRDRRAIETVADAPGIRVGAVTRLKVRRLQRRVADRGALFLRGGGACQTYQRSGDGKN